MHSLIHFISDTQENGTCATTFILRDAAKEDMRTSDYEDSFDKAPLLNVDNIILNSDERTAFRKNLTFTIARIIVTNGGPKLAVFKNELNARQPESPEKLKPQKTHLFPLPAMSIDESTIVGNAEVVEEIMKELHLSNKEEFLDYVHIFAGDQLSIARLRSLVQTRAGHEAGKTGFRYGLWMPGLFHAKMADIQGLLITHLGRASLEDPGSLARHNTVLMRNPILLTSPPPFRVCRDLAFVSLYARILHCLLLVSDKASLNDYADSIESFDTLLGHASDILDQHANAALVNEMRQARTDDRPAEGDEIHENAMLCLRDLIISREFTEAIKVNDPDRILYVLRTLALSYRGNGRTKYAYEMLHLIHNLTHVWPKPLR
jgi:hypothetical protein